MALTLCGAQGKPLESAIGSQRSQQVLTLLCATYSNILLLIFCYAGHFQPISPPLSVFVFICICTILSSTLMQWTLFMGQQRDRLQNSFEVLHRCRSEAAVQLVKVIVKTGSSSLLHLLFASTVKDCQTWDAMPTAKSANYPSFLGESSQNVKEPQNEKRTVRNRIQRQHHL